MLWPFLNHVSKRRSSLRRARGSRGQDHGPRIRDVGRGFANSLGHGVPELVRFGSV
jgi:hypothetical protein